MKYLLSIILILLIIIVVSFLYYTPTPLEENSLPTATSSIVISDDMNFFDCLEYSHGVTGEGVLAREAALQAVVTKVIDFIGVQVHKVVDCF